MSSWDKLSLKEKAAMIKVGVLNGLTSISDIKELYNKFLEINASAGNLVKAVNENTKLEIYLGKPSHNYDFTLSEEWADARGYYPDNRGHRDDRVKKPSHPTHPSRGYFKSMNLFDLSDKGFEDPNYTLYGLNDGGQDPQSVMTYKGGIVLPEVTVTPKGNYIYNSYDNIVNKFDEGGYKEVDTRVGKFKSGSFVKLKGENFWRRVNTDGTLTQVYDGTYGTYDYRNKNVPKKVVDSVKWHKALYNTINPIGGYPSNIFEGIVKRNRVINKKDSENIDRMSYSIENKISHKVADAAWRKYNGIPYDEKFLPKGKEDTIGGFKHTVRLPKELELEIPVDTNLLKERIELNLRYLLEHPYNVPESVRIALSSDQNALNALRKTYSTGLPVGLNEASYNSRNWGTTGYTSDSPLNVLANYNVRYSPEENRMYYSDTYGFDSDDSWYVDLLGGYDNYLEGNPFRIRGFVDLNDTSNQSKKFGEGGPTDQPGVNTWDAQWLAKEKRKLRLKEEVTKNKEIVGDVAETVASFAPGVGELLDLKLIYNDAKLGNYGSMAAGIGFFLLPEALEQAIKGGIKVARKFIPKTKSAKLADEFNRAVSETKLPETKSTKAKTVEHKPTSTLQENLLTLLNVQDINRINSIKSNISEAERMGIPKGERNYKRRVIREYLKGPILENDVWRNSNTTIVGQIQLSDDLSDIARPFKTYSTYDLSDVLSGWDNPFDRFSEFHGSSIYDDVFNDLGSQLTYVHPSILAKGPLRENPMIWDYRRYLLSQGIPSENISTETLEKILSLLYQLLTNTMTGKAKGLVLWNGSPNWFDEFNFAENIGTISHNLGNAGVGTYFSRGRLSYGLTDQRGFSDNLTTIELIPFQLDWNMQPYLITDIKSMPHYNQIEHLPENGTLLSRDLIKALKPNDLLVINTFGGMRYPTLQPTKFQTMENMGDKMEFRLRRNTGIKSLFPHPDTFVRNPDGSVSILRDWNDPRVNYKHGGKLNVHKFLNGGSSLKPKALVRRAKYVPQEYRDPTRDYLKEAETLIWTDENGRPISRVDLINYDTSDRTVFEPSNILSSPQSDYYDLSFLNNEKRKYPAQDYRFLENIVKNDPNGPYAATNWLLGQQVALSLGALGVVTAPAAVTVGGIAGGVGGDILGNYASDWLFNNPDKEYKLNQDITITPREASRLSGSIIGGGLGGYRGYVAANTGRNYLISRELNRAVKEFDGTVGDSYFHAPDRFYRITSTPEIYGLLELGMNVTTRDLPTMSNQADAFRTLVLNKGLVPGKGELEGYWIYPENIRKGALQKRIKEELGIKSSRFNLDENPFLFTKHESAHGNRTLAGWLKIWEGTTINDSRFPSYILEGHPLQNLTIPYGKNRSYFIDTPIDNVPKGSRVGFKTGEMPMEGLNKFRLLPNGRYLYEGPVLPDKRIIVNEPVTKPIFENNGSNKTNGYNNN